MLCVNYEDIHLPRPTFREKIDAFSIKFDEVKSFSSELLDLCGEFNHKIADTFEVILKLANLFSRPPLFSPEELWFKETLQKGSKILLDYSSSLHSLRAQINQGVLGPLCQFVSKDTERMSQEARTYQESIENHGSAVDKFCQLSKKKETERSLFEAQGDVYLTARQYHQAATEYCSSLNIFKYSYLGELTEPLLEFLKSLKPYLSQAQSKDHEEKLFKMSTLASMHLKRLQLSSSAVNKEVFKQKEKSLKEFPLKYTPDPDPRDPFSEFSLADPNLLRKEGYLYVKSPRGAWWERLYVFISKQKLMIYTSKDEEPTELLSLCDTQCTNSEVDDRRYVFEVTNGAESMFLQAESAVAQDEWMIVIRNQASRSSQEDMCSQVTAPKFVKTEGTPSTNVKVASERESIKMWIDRQVKKNKRSKGGGGKVTRYQYTVRFLGRAPINEAKNHSLVAATLRKNWSEKSPRKEKSALYIEINGLRWFEGKTTQTIKWKDVALCSYVPENEKVFGVVHRAPDKKFVCLMFEAEQSGKIICASCNEVIKAAVAIIQAKQTSSEPSKPRHSESSGSLSDMLLPHSGSTQSLLSDISEDEEVPSQSR